MKLKRVITYRVGLKLVSENEELCENIIYVNIKLIQTKVRLKEL